MIMRSKALRIKTPVLLTLVMFICGFSPVWFIVDPVRDANWILKQIQKGIAWVDEARRNHATLQQNQRVSEDETKMREKFASANIRAQTTAISITQNNASEDRYAIDMMPQQVCSFIREKAESIGVFNRQEDCDRRTESTIAAIEATLKREPAHTRSFMNRAAEHTKASTQDSKDKRQIEGYFTTINNAAEAFKTYSVIDKATYEDIQAASSLLFLDNIRAPLVGDILKGHEWDVNRMRTLQSSLLLRDLILDEQLGRVADAAANKNAIDSSLIDQGSWERHLSRLENADSSTSSYKVVRQRALMLSARLSSKYKRLKFLRDWEVLTALKVKAMQEKGEL
ncbi:hypothetical protein KW429_11010 [Vibrio fluvialis]|nr:hypothetical protein [Vibrio fluvialis]MBY7902382.1 hypothetical protein [Vibrio fluvialis]